MFYALHSVGFSGVTAELSVRFLHPVPTATDLQLTAEAVRVERRLGTAKASLSLGSRVLARATAKFLVPRMDP